MWNSVFLGETGPLKPCAKFWLSLPQADAGRQGKFTELAKNL